MVTALLFGKKKRVSVAALGLGSSAGARAQAQAQETNKDKSEKDEDKRPAGGGLQNITVTSTSQRRDSSTSSQQKPSNGKMIISEKRKMNVASSSSSTISLPTKLNNGVLPNIRENKMPIIQLPEEQKWIKSFNELKTFQEINKRMPNEGDNIFSKYPKMDELLKWITQQRHEYKRYLKGEETALSQSRVYLLRNIGILDDMNEIKAVTNERRCIIGGCRRVVANESLYCTEHRGAGESVTDQTQHNKPTEYKSSETSYAKRQKHNDTGELHTNTNGAQHTLKSPPELECRAMTTLVELAAETVAKEVRYLALESSTEKAELAIKRFAMDIYYPMLYTSFKEQGTETSYSALRVLISTLIAIREMLIINSEKFFPFETPKDSSTHKESGEEATSKLISRDIACAVVQNSAKALQRKSPDIFLKLKVSNEDSLFDQYLEASKSYDSKGDEFQFALGRVDARAVYQTAKGSQLGERESIMARTGFNYAREHHPLIQHNDGTSTGLRDDSQPVPNVCFFVMGGDETKSEKNEISKSINNVEESHDVMKDERVKKIHELKRRYEGISKHNR
jgi:hypothetical protein